MFLNSIVCFLDVLFFGVLANYVITYSREFFRFCLLGNRVPLFAAQCVSELGSDVPSVTCHVFLNVILVGVETSATQAASKTGRSILEMRH